MKREKRKKRTAKGGRNVIYHRRNFATIATALGTTTHHWSLGVESQER